MNEVNGRKNDILHIVLCLLCGVLLRAVVTLHSYSGQNQPPMFGDYEAQRHWMEITYNLPIQDWYRNTSENDLQYWGLDYPPVAAYHSLLVGGIAAHFNQTYVSLHHSRGLESIDHKTFMRSSVLLSDILTFIPAALFYFVKERESFRLFMYLPSDFLLLIMIYPGLILIDHGHFQYNCVPLGLTTLAITFLFQEKLFFSSVLFSLSINCKQMSLYHALPFFVFMLRRCFREKTLGSICNTLIRISGGVMLTFLVVWSPFLTNTDAVVRVLQRLFPLARGLFEDKVGNVWCAVNVIYKLKNLFPIERMVRICASCTLFFSIPSLVRLALTPSHRQFLLSLINVSLAFYLFSFQVHEKSILFVCLPVLLYAPYDITASLWFLSIANVSLMHLFIKDNLFICYIMLMGLFQMFIMGNEKVIGADKHNIWYKLAMAPSVIGTIVLIVGFIFVTPPVRYPDLWPLLNAMFSFVHFFAFFVYFNFSQLFRPDSALNIYNFRKYSTNVSYRKISESRGSRSKRKNSYRDKKD